MGGFKLGKMTLGSLFKKPETVLYPVEKKEAPAGLKGHIVNDADVCILCGICCFFQFVLRVLCGGKQRTVDGL